MTMTEKMVEEGIRAFLEANQRELQKFLQELNKEKNTQKVVPMGEVERILKGIEPEEELQIAEKEKDRVRTSDNQKRIHMFLREMGIPCSMKGFNYLVEAIQLGQEDEEQMEYITKSIYPEVARKFKTATNLVESCIRHAIEAAWKIDDNESLKGVFKTYPGKKPTNSEFIAVVLDILKFN